MVKSKRKRWARNVTHMGSKRNGYRPLVGKLGERPLERSRQRSKYNLKMDLGERRCDGMAWIDLTQYRDL
jgi:hypothetical protein